MKYSVKQLNHFEYRWNADNADLADIH